MSEKRFYITDTGLGLDTVSDELYSFGDEEDFCRLFDKLNEQQATIERLEEENEQLKAKVKRLQDIATRTEEEKEHYADIYNECRRLKLSDEAIKQAYADLNRREREKHSQGNATYTGKINRTEVIY